jgi:hypothetical protein
MDSAVALLVHSATAALWFRVWTMDIFQKSKTGHISKIGATLSKIFPAKIYANPYFSKEGLF